MRAVAPLLTLTALGLLTPLVATADSLESNQATTTCGVLQGTLDAATGVRSFKGIPFAQPPVGDLRWREPQPPQKWSGVRNADKFGPRAMQRPIFSDMVFRSDGVSEDCLYLNVWTPAKSTKERLPVLVYFYGGGFMAGDGSELRYDGESLAGRGIVTVTVNYRLGIFGFLAHPELTKESPHHASGNYGLLDQSAALRWVHANIAAFGGDPKQVTIAGESAGSISVSAQMCSPLSKGLFARAIGESGSLLGALTPVSLSEGEGNGNKFISANGGSIAGARALSAEAVLEAASKPGSGRAGLVVDGYFLPKSPFAIFEAGEQAHVPLLVGWNSEEGNYRGVLWQAEPTVENFKKALERLYPGRGETAFAVYHPATDQEVMQVATDLASDRFIAFSTWRWADMHNRTGHSAVYRYYYSHPRPATKPKNGAPAGGAARGAVHSAEIEYALGNLPSNEVFDWTADDFAVSKTMEAYFEHFIKKATPNGKGLPEWPKLAKGAGAQYLRIDVQSHAEPETHRDRYLFLEEDTKK